MIKALRIECDLESKAQFNTLREFLDSLGFLDESGTRGKNDTAVTFSAPTGKISLEWSETESVTDKTLWDFAIEIDDPDSTYDLIRSKDFEIISDYSESQTGGRHFVVRVTEKISVAVFGTPRIWLETKRAGDIDAKGKRFAIAVSRFNSFITQRLLDGAVDGLRRTGAHSEDIFIVHVPGAFELPSAARTLAETKKYDAVICIGCLLRGDTAHYDVIVNEVTRGIGQSAQETGVPHAFGVLTCDTLEQAIDRAGLKMGNKGLEAALAAVEMANLKSAIDSQLAAVGQGGRKSKDSASLSKPLKNRKPKEKKIAKKPIRASRRPKK